MFYDYLRCKINKKIRKKRQFIKKRIKEYYIYFIIYITFVIFVEIILNF